MEAWIAIIAIIALAIFTITAAVIQAIAVICKHGGVTIHVILDSPADTTATEPAMVLTEEEQKAMDEYNKQQSEFLSSIRNLQKLFIYEDQMVKEDK